MRSPRVFLSDSRRPRPAGWNCAQWRLPAAAYRSSVRVMARVGESGLRRDRMLALRPPPLGERTRPRPKLECDWWMRSTRLSCCSNERSTRPTLGPRAARFLPREPRRGRRGGRRPGGRLRGGRIGGRARSHRLGRSLVHFLHPFGVHRRCVNEERRASRGRGGGGQDGQPARHLTQCRRERNDYLQTLI